MWCDAFVANAVDGCISYDALVANTVDGCITLVVDYKKGEGILTTGLFAIKNPCTDLSNKPRHDVWSYGTDLTARAFFTKSGPSS